MAKIETWFNQDLKHPVKVQYLGGNIFSADNAGNLVGVNVFDDGEPASLSGSVSASVIRADGNTVAVTGTLSGNQVSIVLPQAAYAVPGVISIVIKLTSGTDITTLCAVVANVYMSTTDTVVDPGTIIPSVETLIAAIETAIASVPADYSSLLAAIASNYSSSKTYPIAGAYAWYNGVLKRSIVPITTAESYTAAHWTDAIIGDDLSAQKSALIPCLYNQRILANPELFNVAGTHFFEIDTTGSEDFTSWTETDGVFTEVHDGTLGTPLIKCPKYLCFEFHNTTERMKIYFYRYTSGNYVRDDAVLYLKLGANVNVLRYAPIANRVLPVQDINDNLYMQIAVTVGTPKIYGWDGSHIGPDVSGTVSVPYEGATTPNELNMRLGSSAITVPGNVKYLIGRDVCFNYIYGVYNDGASARARETIGSADDNQMFVKLPDGYDYFRVRLKTKYSIPYNGTTPTYSNEQLTTDLNDSICMIAPYNSQPAVFPANIVIDTAKKLCGIKWTAKKAQSASDNTGTFEKDKVYSGIPYHSDWHSPCYVGWHVSVENMLNAINDPDSIFYNDNESVVRGGPGIGLVCSSYATLCSGWQYPMTNEAFHYHPYVKTGKSFMPSLGSIYSNRAQKHCCIIEKYGSIGDAAEVLLYEQVAPKTTRTALFGAVKSAWDDWTKTNESRINYLQEYVYVPFTDWNPSTKPPYSIDEAEVANGNARPHRGNKSVYTSNDDIVINVKAGETLYIQKMDYSGGVFTPSGNPITLQVTTGANTLPSEIKEQLEDGTIYGISTNTDTELYEYFEYHIVDDIQLSVENNNYVFSRNDFWYAFFSSGATVEDRAISIGHEDDADYREYADVVTITGNGTAFYKGTLGAYTASVILVS